MAVFLLSELLDENKSFVGAKLGVLQFWKLDKLGRLIGDCHFLCFDLLIGYLLLQNCTCLDKLPCKTIAKFGSKQ